MWNSMQRGTWGGGGGGDMRGRIRFVQAQDQQVVVTRSPRIITERLLTRLLYVHAIYSRFCIDTTITMKFDESFRFYIPVLLWLVDA